MGLQHEGRRIAIRGVVQGVGFRPWVFRLAHESGIAGRVHNDAAGVTIEAFGSPGALADFLRRLEGGAPGAARIRSLVSEPIPPEALATFRIEDSGARHERRVSIPPDLAVCDECLADVAEASGRRHRYPFTNCTRCGPRFTIARDVPYDRATTTMAPFRMCPECQAEYDSVEDRRFHAQPNACPRCGPRLVCLAPDGTAGEGGDPISSATAALRAGRIVAIKGIGGFHLACDATAPAAVARLRERKRRDEKPFAVMVRSLAAAEAVAVLGPAERSLLVSVERPIVLARRRETSPLAPEVAPRNPLVGLLLPYSPLHHLLLEEADRPLVMTSGNLAEEPLAYRDEEALRRLGGVADLLLVHDREIESPCDDSVARVIGGGPTLLRRSRGYVPRPIPVARPFARPVLACGAQLKNAFCIGAGDSAQLGPHVGDLENLETFEAYQAAVARMERFLRVAPELVAHDLHPAYLSTEYALRRPEPVKVAVQHHHAHVASAMAEHGLRGPVLGVAYDGTGYGTDGTAWGGELLLADYAGFQRLATFRPIRLAGGDLAIREVWRVALALVEDAFDARPPLDRLPVLAAAEPAALGTVRKMIAQGLNSPLARGVGRYFDGAGALVLGRRRSAYEGQIALEWNLAADPAEGGRYGFEVDWEAEPWTVDLRSMVREMVDDVLAGRGAGAISARFHNTLVAATAALVREAARRHGAQPVVLTGGCFQNPWLAEGVLRELSPALDVRLHREVPPGDGGIALGQALVADAVARGRD